MIRLKLLLTILIFTLAENTFAQKFEWARHVGGTKSEDGKDLVIDDSGNLYVTGYFEGTVDFDPSSRVSNLTSNGNWDIFILKLNVKGDFVWVKQFGSSNIDEGHSIALDDSGNIFCTGNFRGTLDFDPSSGTAMRTPIGVTDCFVLKLDNAGNFEWVKQFGGSLGVNGLSISLDNRGNIYTTGQFNGTADFDPSTGTSNLTGFGDRDIFVSKLNALGNFIWVRQMGGSGWDQSQSIEIDVSGNVYTTGHFAGTSDFDPSSSTYNLTSNSFSDIFISKLDSLGNFVWALKFGTIDNNNSNSIVSDADGFIYTTGRFQGTVDFDPGFRTFNLTSAGNSDAFVLKLSATGSFVWVKQFSGTQGVQGNSIHLDGFGNVFSIGNFTGTVDFDPGSATKSLTSNGQYNIYISKLNDRGNFVWVKQLGGLNHISISGKSIEIDDSGNIFTTGYFDNVADFDPGIDTLNHTSKGSYDVFIHKISLCYSKSTDIKTACNSYKWIDGKTYTQNNNTATFRIIGKAFGECDSLVTLNLTIINSPTGIDTQIACDSFKWIDEKTYKLSNNTAQFKILGGAVNGCDSIVKLNLTILNSSTGTYTQTSCNSFKWIDGITYTSSNDSATYTIVGGAKNGCDSIVKLNLTILNSPIGNDIKTACNSYKWIDGITYISSNDSATYTIVGGAKNGCDSIVKLNLTILNSSIGTDNQIACNSYTWIDGKTYTSNNNTATFNLVGAAANGCDSLVTLDLTILKSANGTDNQTACNSYTWIDGKIYTSSNNSAQYNIDGGAANGCDSLVTLNLTINNVSNITTTTSGSNITANNNMATYQWLDCNNNFTEISGATNQIFTPTANGSYAVELTENSCVDTSSCVVISSLNIVENNLGFEFVFYPNPTNGNLKIELGKELNNVKVTVRNLLGQEVYYKHYASVNQIDLNLESPSGIYLIEILSNGKKAVLKIIKE